MSGRRAARGGMITDPRRPEDGAIPTTEPAARAAAGPPGKPRAGERSEEDLRALAASHVAASFANLAAFAEDPPKEVARNSSPNQPDSRHPRLTGTEVEDRRLLTASPKPLAAPVVTIDAYPHPAEPEKIVVRLDGWEGHLELRLSRDRAALLAARLREAIDRAQASYDSGPKGP
jgi:hypothetical protein